MPRAAAIYVRISEDRSGQRLGVKRQEDDCQALADRKGWPVAEVFGDNDQSATKGKPRPGYSAMLEAIKSNDVDAVIVWDQDRLVRHPRELEQFFDVCDGAGLTHLATVGGDLDLGTGEGLLVARIKGAVAAEETRKLGQRQRRKQRELAERGRWSGGPRPFGYRVVKGEGLVVDDAEAELVREAAQAIIAGTPLAVITADWRARDIRGTRGACRWLSDDVRRVLTSPRIAGLRALHGRVLGPATWPAIVDEATWQRLQAAIADPRARNPARSYLLSGLVYCGRCEERLHAMGRYDSRLSAERRGQRSYMCRPDKGGCSGIRIDAEGIEGAVVDALLRGLAATKPLASALKRRTRADKADATIAAVEADEAALALLSQRFFVERSISDVEYQASRGPLEERIAAGRRQLVAVDRKADVVAQLAGKGVRGKWEALTFDQQRAVLFTLVERIVVGPAVPPKNRFNDKRLTPDYGGNIVWRR